MHRTTAITAAAITGVVLAGTAAIAANIGILTAADDQGELGTATALQSPASSEPQIVEVYLDELTTATVATPTSSAAGSQEFLVDPAGTVTVVQTGDGIALGAVATNEGWTWKLSQTTPIALRVTLTDGRRTLELNAFGGANGPIVASVDDIIITTSPPMGGPAGTTPPTPTTPGAGTISGHDDDDGWDDDEDDDHDEDEDEDDDDEHEDEHEDEHDGRDDDD